MKTYNKFVDYYDEIIRWNWYDIDSEVFFVNELIENNLEKRPHPNPPLIGEGIAKNTYAVDYSDRKIFLAWKKLWVLVWSSTNMPVQEIESVTNSGFLDIVTTNDTYKLNIDNTTSITWTWLVLSSFTNNATCNRLKRFEWIKNNWIYTINPTWTEEVKVYCNMELGWGWWTLIATTADDWDKTWTYDNRDLLTNTTTTWSLDQKEKDFKSKVYSQIKFKDMMFEDKQWEWWAYDDINPAYNQTVAQWMPMTLACAFWAGRDYYLTSWSISITKWADGTQQDRWLFFSVYDNEGWCNPSNSTGDNAIWPTWWYRANWWLSPDDPGAMWWGPNILTWNSSSSNEAGDAKLGKKNHIWSETNDWDYIFWYVR